MAAYLQISSPCEKNLQVDQLLRLKPTEADLFYPTVRSYKVLIENASDDENLKREAINERDRMDWENECIQIKNRGPLIERSTWYDADIKVKSLIYFSLGT